ncbi:MAG: hypothetical protein HY791_35820 [Deltaproteobacteria bacterium]|nr:hypothetical protein [Deltaproteobacteria bacterium]
MTQRVGLALVSFFASVLAGCASDTTGLDGGLDAGPADTGAPAACQNDDGCPSEQFCTDQNVCVPGNGNACADDEGCAPFETCEVVSDCGASRCHGNHCAPRACANDVECEPGTCSDQGSCEPPVSCATEPCPSGFTCVADACVPNGCENDGDCEGDRICLEGACADPTPCARSNECPNDLVCQNGTCREPCQMDGDCGNPAVAWACTNGVCERRCIGDGTCPGGFICESRICEPSQCSENAECGASNQRCAGAPDHGRCKEFTPCTQGGNECAPNFRCENDACIELPTCISDRNCDATSYCESAHCQPSASCSAGSPCAAGTECVADRCVPIVCRSSSDCSGTDLCIGGVCQPAPSTATVIDVRILTPAGYVRPNETYAFAAVALDPAGNVVPGVSFTWRSAITDVATIAANGVATGGANAGETFITASTDNGTSTITSVPVSLFNLGPATDPLRVSVTDLATGAPVAGAKVRAGTQEVTTDAVGSALFSTVTFPVDITVAHGAHDWVSLIGVESTGPSTDLAVPLPSITRQDRVAGLKGSVDFSAVTETGLLSASLSGASFASPMFAFFEPAQIFGGDQFTVTVTPPGGGNGFSFPVAANATLSAEVFGAPFSLKDTFYARARPGTRSAWCFAGRLGDGNFVDGLAQLADGPAGLLPFLQNFRHSVRPFQPVLALATVTDAGDIDGDGDSSERVPDYASFPSLSFRPEAQQNLRFNLTAQSSALPFVYGGIADTLIVMSGVLLPGTGFVPLGFDGYRDEQRTGLAPDLITRMAPPHGGLEAGNVAVIVAAVRTEGAAIPGPGAAQIHVFDRLPTSVDLSSGWINSPTGGSVSGRTIAQPRIPGADFVHATLFAQDGAWHVYWPASMEQLSVPAAPTGFSDRLGGGDVALDAVDVESSPSLSELFQLGHATALELDRATRRFSRAFLAR